jgi:L-seryl-tRNA(Ser) seleniumtransferase
VVDLDPRRSIPRTDAVLAVPDVAAALERLRPAEVLATVHRAQQEARTGAIAPDEVVSRVIATLPERPIAMREVVNATGVIVHTNLGRAPLSTAAREAIASVAGYVDVEFDLDQGARARRGRGAIDALLAAVPEAQAALVLNNNASGLVLAATALAASREILISRGEMVEIGDGFRLPELLESTGARLREVGTTNRTTAHDYVRAIGPQTGMLLKVHPSNFVIEGFVSAVPTAELAGLGPPLVVDIGSGLLAPEPLLPAEPDASSELAAGADLVLGSGDKLLGGPQAGIVLGARPLVEQLRRHPLARALRVDKLALAALEATLRGPLPPVVAALRIDGDELRARAHALAARLASDGVPAEAVDTVARVGGGGGVGVDLPSAAVALPVGYARAVRLGHRPVVGRVEDERCLLDLRAVPPESDEDVYAAVVTASSRLG